MPTVKAVSDGEEEHAVQAIVLAFAADPVARWTWRIADQYLSSMPQLVRAFGGGAFAHGAAYCTDDLGGAALWLPPGVNPDEERLGAVIERTVEPSRHADVFGTF